MRHFSLSVGIAVSVFSTVATVALATPAAVQPGSEFAITTQPALPEFSAAPEQYRIGLANLMGREFVMYLGERLYLWQWSIPQPTTASLMKVGVSAGIHVGLFLEERGSKFQFDTEDGYFGLMWEWAFDQWGVGAGFAHLSAHVGDGRFRTTTPITYNQNFGSFRVVVRPHSRVDLQLETHLYGVDAPQGRTAETHLAVAFYPWPFLSLEGDVAADDAPNSIDVFRFKISGLFPGRDTDTRTLPPSFIPYVLLHHGKHLFAQRYLESVDWVALAGLEFNL